MLGVEFIGRHSANCVECNTREATICIVKMRAANVDSATAREENRPGRRCLT